MGKRSVCDGNMIITAAKTDDIFDEKIPESPFASCYHMILFYFLLKRIYARPGFFPLVKATRYYTARLISQ
jgi:hypothetical protein